MEKISKRKEKITGENIASQTVNGKLIPTSQSTKKENGLSTSTPIKTPTKKKKAVKKIKEETLNINGNIPYTFDTILKPPISNSLMGNDSENILDDLIEAPTKIKSSNGINRIFK